MIALRRDGQDVHHGRGGTERSWINGIHGTSMGFHLSGKIPTDIYILATLNPYHRLMRLPELLCPGRLMVNVGQCLQARQIGGQHAIKVSNLRRSW